MRRCKSVLAFALALILALAPVISPLHINAAESTEVSGDIVSGYDFEDDGDVGHFSSAENDTTIERVTYTDAGVDVPTNGKSYALQLSRDSKTLSFRIGFGKELAAGTVIRFDAYGQITTGGFGAKNKLWTLKDTSDNPLATDIQPDNWKTVTVTLSKAAEYIDLVWSCSTSGIFASVESGVLFVDNFKAVEPLRFTGDFWIGVGLEDAGDILQFVGQNSGHDATIERVTYTDADVTAPANGGSYVLKVSHENDCWPTFRVNFNETLPANTMVTFDIYGNYTSDASGKYMKLELTGDSKNNALSEDPNHVVWTLTENWAKATIILTAETDYVDFMYNVADGTHGDVASWMLLDNFKATMPNTPVGDILVGYGFEVDGNQWYFEGIEGNQAAILERVSYADAGISGNGGSYALKASHANDCWPKFRLNFGKTLKRCWWICCTIAMLPEPTLLTRLTKHW